MLILSTCCVFASAHAQVTVHTMMKEMYDLERLTRRPSPAYTMAQASSYDRASTKPGFDSWLAKAYDGK